MIPGHSVSTVEVAAAFRCSWQLAGKVVYIFSSVVNLEISFKDKLKWDWVQCKHMLRNDGQARRYHFFQARTVTCLVGLTCELVGNCLLLTEALRRKNRKCSNAVLYLSFPCLLCTAGQCQRVNCTRNNNTCVFTIATFPLLFRQLTAA